MNRPDEVRVARPALRALAVDDEPLQLDEIAYLLRNDAGIAEVLTAGDTTEALRQLRDRSVDVVFLDVRMPGLDGVELGRVLGRFEMPPAVVFVTAHDDRAVDAFELGATDYLLKPVQADRLAEAVRRAARVRSAWTPDEARTQSRGTNEPAAEDLIPIELAGTTRMLPRSAVRWVEAHGDYARLHTSDGSHLVRVPLSLLADRWADAGFVRIHRSYLVALKVIAELRLGSSGYVVIVDGRELAVSRRHTRELKDRLVRAAKSGWR